MMRENGVVAGIDGGKARINMEAAGHTQCTACGLCRKAADSNIITIDVAAPEGLQVGDHVVVEIPGPGQGVSTTILLLVPLLLFIGGVILGEVLRRCEVVSFQSWFSVLLGFVLMAAAFFGAAIYDRYLQKSPRHQPRIIEINGTGV